MVKTSKNKKNYEHFIINQVNNIINDTTKAFEKSVTKIDVGDINNIGDFNDFVLDLGNDIGDVTTDVVNNTGDIAKNTVNEIEGGISTMGKELENFTDLSLESFEKIFGAIAKDITGIIKELGKVKEIVSFIETVIKELKNLTLQIIDELGIIKVVFNDIINFFKTIGDVFTVNGTTSSALIATLTIPFFGQLYARLVLLGGSLDKPWLFLFSIPPLTVVPTIMILFKQIEEIKGGDAIDTYVFVPIILNILVSLFVGSDPILKSLKLITILASFYWIFWYKATKICGEKDMPNTNKIILDSTICYIVILILVASMEYIPYIGNVYGILKNIFPKADLIIETIFIIICYVITNMINGSFGGYCNSKTDTIDLVYVVAVAIGLSMSILTVEMLENTFMEQLMAKM